MQIPKPYRTFPLRTTLVVAVITTALIVMGILLGWVGIPAYHAAKREVRDLWKNIAEQVAGHATEQVLSYFQNAPITLKVIEGLVEEKQLKIGEFETIMDICYRTLKENSTFVAVYYSKKDGSFYGLFKLPDGYEASYRSIQPDGKTLIRNYKANSANQWVQIEEKIGDYDPRKRPFWKTALAHPEGAWSDPYRFATTGALGYTYTLGQKVGNEIDGYWSVNFQLDRLVYFLRSLKIGARGVVYLVTDEGEVVSESAGEVDPSIHQIVEQYFSSGRQTGYYPLRNEIFYANQFPQELEIPWSVITSIHEDDFLKPIRDQSIRSLQYGIIPCILFLIFVAVFFGSVSRRLKEIAWEMDEVGNLNFRIRSSDSSRSRIREINAMNHALSKMKIGLQSFAKYVPSHLIKKLLFSGHAAEPGAEKKEITVFFADLEQFTAAAELLQPDEVAKIIEEFLTLASEEVHQEQGIVDKFIGDAVMALWGVPDPIPNPPLAACRTALILKQKLQSNPRMKHKIGINTGLAMVGNFGSNERLDYTAIGDTVNIAARLEKINKLYGTNIVMGPITAAAVEDTLLVRPLNWVMLEGRSTPLLAYELIGEKKEMPDNILQAVSTYASALEAHQHKRFKEAAVLFDKANTLFGGADTPSKLMKEESLKLAPSSKKN